jgi:hypothetical protein
MARWQATGSANLRMALHGMSAFRESVSGIEIEQKEFCHQKTGPVKQ